MSRINIKNLKKKNENYDWRSGRKLTGQTMFGVKEREK
jgi:hypothetical protein